MNLKALIQVCKLTYNKLISSPKYYGVALFLIAIILKKKFMPSLPVEMARDVSLSDFLNKINEGVIQKVLIKKNKLFFLSNDNILYQTTHSLFPKKQLFDRLIKGNVNFETLSANFNAKKVLTVLVISSLVSYLISFILTNFQFSWNKEEKNKNPSTFKDVVGLDECKIALKEVIDFMKNPQSFKQNGARMRRGVVFYGPSGTGKTSLAKACAGEAGVPFFSCNAAQFKQMYVGVGAKKVRQLFKKARQNVPSIIYIDQIDAMGNRSNSSINNLDGAGSQKNTTINQLLSQMDGFKSNQMILVIGSTNKLDYIDQALLRPGRFDLKIKVPLPNQKDRFQILNHYLTNKKHNLSQKYLKQTVEKLKNWSGADLQNLANEAVYTSLRRKSQHIQQQDIQNTLKVLI